MSVSNKTKSFISNGKVLLMIRNMIYVSLCVFCHGTKWSILIYIANIESLAGQILFFTDYNYILSWIKWSMAVIISISEVNKVTREYVIGTFNMYNAVTELYNVSFINIWKIMRVILRPVLDTCYPVLKTFHKYKCNFRNFRCLMSYA